MRAYSRACKGAAWAGAHRIAKAVWLVLHQEVEYQEKGGSSDFAPLPSIQAADDSLYPRHGLVDASFDAVAREQKCAVLTDDLDLFPAVTSEKLEAVNFAPLRAQQWGIEPG